MLDVDAELKILEHLKRMGNAQSSGDFDALMGALKVIIALNEKGDDKAAQEKSFQKMGKLFDAAFADVLYASEDASDFLARGVDTITIAMDLEKFAENIGAMRLFATVACIHAISGKLVNALKANLSFSAISATLEEIEKITPDMFDPSVVGNIYVEVEPSTKNIKFYEVK